MTAMRDPSSQPSAGSVELRNRREEIDAIEDLVVDTAESLGYPRSSCFALRLALEEAITNAFRHGHAGLPADTPVKVEYAIHPDRIELSVEDRGPGFCPQAVPDPTLDENLEMPGGRGIVLMRAYMTKVSHNQQGNRVEMILERPADDPG